jgi:hypothetical protein
MRPKIGRLDEVSLHNGAFKMVENQQHHVNQWLGQSSQLA